MSEKAIEATAHRVYDVVYKANGFTLNAGEAVYEAIKKELAVLPQRAGRDEIARLHRRLSDYADARGQLTSEDAHKIAAILAEQERPAQEDSDLEPIHPFGEGASATALEITGSWTARQERRAPEGAVEEVHRKIQSLFGAVSKSVARELVRIIWTYTSPPAPSVPEGWQLVPKEPTSPMFFGWTEWMVKNTTDKMVFGEFKRDYQAMLAAAPSSPAPASEGGWREIEKIRANLRKAHHSLHRCRAEVTATRLRAEHIAHGGLCRVRSFTGRGNPFGSSLAPAARGGEVGWHRLSNFQSTGTRRVASAASTIAEDSRRTSMSLLKSNFATVS